MKYTKLIVPAFAVVLCASFVTVALAAAPSTQGKDYGEEQSTEVNSAMPVPGNADVKEMEVIDEDDEGDLIDTVDEDSNKHASMGEEHRSAVAKAVASLLMVADRAGGIGQEVRDVAQEEKDTHDKVADMMDTIEKRNGLMTFLFGTDYKNLGVLRSTLVTSENGIDRLMKAKEKANRSVQPDIDTQIEALKAENAKVQAFITENESKFSIFGWLVRFFSN